MRRFEVGRGRGGFSKDYHGSEFVVSSNRRCLMFPVQIGEPTILINNAGVVQGKLVIDLSVEDVQQYVVYLYQVTSFLSSSFRTFGVNTFSHFWILKAFLPAMLKKKSGHIVGILQLPCSHYLLIWLYQGFYVICARYIWCCPDG